VLWTYPANGDVDVPTDSSLWLAANVSSFGQVPTVELNGTAVSVQAESLSALAPLRFEPPTLAPDTSYVWTLRYPPTDGQSATTFEVQFKTGKRQRRAAPKVRVVAHAEHDVASSAGPCTAILAAQRCFDTIGQRPPRRHELVVTPTSAVGWLVRSAKGERILWPAVCGAPQIIIDESESKECFALQSIGLGGQLGPRRDFCSGEKHAPLPRTAGAPPPAGLSPIAPQPSPAALTTPEAGVPAAAAPPAQGNSAEPAAKPDAVSQGGCSLGGGHAPGGCGVALVLTGLWLRRRRARA
jgi:hypothetical protein